MLVAVEQELPCITLHFISRTQHLTAARGLAAAARENYNWHCHGTDTWYFLHDTAPQALEGNTAHASQQAAMLVTECGAAPPAWEVNAS